MSDRPTPEQIACTWMQESGMSRIMQDVIEELGHHGYVIVHPDNVPHATHASAAYSEGWTDCRRHIFGGDR